MGGFNTGNWIAAGGQAADNHNAKDDSAGGGIISL